MTLHVFIVRSGDGREFPLGTVESLEQAENLIADLEAAFTAWEDAGFPELEEEDDPVGAFEGCDAWTRSSAGELLMMIDEGHWERL